jgi:hypothetical protein
MQGRYRNGEALRMNFPRTDDYKPCTLQEGDMK